MVFVGTVASVDATRNVATIDVQEIWRGPNLADPIAVSGGQSVPGSSALQWEVGQRYLVIPTVTSAGDLVADGCSPTSVYKAEYDAFRPAGAYPPQGPPTSGVPGAPPIAAIFLVILVLGSIGGFFLYRTRPPG